MKNDNSRIKGILLIGNEATIIPYLAMIGAVSIISMFSCVSYKLGEARGNKKNLKQSIKESVEDTDE